MIDCKQLERACIDGGFDAAACIDVSQFVLLPEIRSMCTDNRCGASGKNWACPPHCGTLEECQSRLNEYTQGVVVQTITQLEDSFDIEGMEAAGERHNKLFGEVAVSLREKYPQLLGLGAGGCRVCAECTCPDAPCRFPEKRFSPMEAYGLWVSDVCTRCGLPYNNGEATITYVSCYLVG